MITPPELRETLGAMDDEQFQEFQSRFGGDDTREGYVDSLVRDPSIEPRLCQILQVPTELERQNEANQKLVDSSVDAAVSARRSANYALWTFVVSVAALLVSVIAVIVSCSARD